MFIRIKSTPNSHRKSVHICESRREGKKVRQLILKCVGMADNETQLQELKKLATYLMNQIEEERKNTANTKTKSGKANHQRKTPVLPADLAEIKEHERVIDGFHDIFGQLFVDLGFNKFISKQPTEVLLNMLIARIAKPVSKRASKDLLSMFFGREITLERIYRMMDLLLPHKEKILKQIFDATCALCEGRVDVLFFDVTTLYFESVNNDGLREFGYSKDQKFHSTQVVLALATNSEGLPIGYELFPGNTAEVSTLLKCLDTWKDNLKIGEAVIVADRAMMSDANMSALEQAGIKYVIAAKLKGFTKVIKDKILTDKGQLISLSGEHHYKQEFTLPNGRRLIVTYSAKRAKKDQKDRQKLIEKMKKKLGKAKDPKSLVSNRGYLKYITVNGKVDLVMDENKIAQDASWDGFHGVITNDTLTDAVKLLQRYRGLWVIEESFRINKHTLSARPIYHYKSSRIEAHILMCYMTFCLLRHAQYRFKVYQKNVSLEEMRLALMSVQTSRLEEKTTGNKYRLPSKLCEKAKMIYEAMGVKRNLYVEKCSVQKKI